MSNNTLIAIGIVAIMIVVLVGIGAYVFVELKTENDFYGQNNSYVQPSAPISPSISPIPSAPYEYGQDNSRQVVTFDTSKTTSFTCQELGYGSWKVTWSDPNTTIVESEYYEQEQVWNGEVIDCDQPLSFVIQGTTTDQIVLTPVIDYD